MKKILFGCIVSLSFLSVQAMIEKQNNNGEQQEEEKKLIINIITTDDATILNLKKAENIDQQISNCTNKKDESFFQITPHLIANYTKRQASSFKEYIQDTSATITRTIEKFSKTEDGEKVYGTISYCSKGIILVAFFYLLVTHQEKILTILLASPKIIQNNNRFSTSGFKPVLDYGYPILMAWLTLNFIFFSGLCAGSMCKSCFDSATTWAYKKTEKLLINKNNKQEEQ